MRKIHVNLLGTWIELDDELDNINNEIPSIWLEEHNLHEHDFIWIKYQGAGYRIHISQVQITVDLIRENNSL